LKEQKGRGFYLPENGVASVLPSVLSSVRANADISAEVNTSLLTTCNGHAPHGILELEASLLGYTHS
jgi:hypothetical protein